VNPRFAAYDVLERIERGERWQPTAGKGRDEGFVRTVVYGALRWQSAIDRWIEVLSGRPIERIDAPVTRILRIGLVQIQWMRVPDYAAVSESVRLAAKKAPRGRSFVNAVLRKAGKISFDSVMPSGSDPKSIATRTAHPPWLIARWIHNFGSQRAEKIALANQQPSYPDVLIDQARVSIGEVRGRLDAEGIDSAVSPLVPGMMRVLGSTAPLEALIADGTVWPMDEGSAIVAMMAGERGEVLDYTAAPGGKTLFMLRGGSRVTSQDVSLERILPLHRIVLPAGRRLRIVVADGTRPPFRGPFSTVLLDAPCSASGIIRKHPEIKWRLSVEGIRAGARLQRELLGAALDLTRERLIYATCSMEPEENDEVVRTLISERTDFVLGDASDVLPESLGQYVSRGILRLTPEAGTDGFTAFLLRRRV
jgi:16S rRNA (cytosine967-C5)-methyltransferase